MASTNLITVTPAAYSSLGTGPLLIEALNQPAVIAIADSQPAAGAAGFAIFPGQPVEFNATTAIWATTAAASSNLTYGPISLGGGGGGGTSSNFGAAFPSAGTAAGAEYLSSAPTLTSGQMVALQTDVNGNLKVNVTAGSSGGAPGYAQGSTTSGEQGPLVQGAVTTSAPSYTSGQTDPLSLTTAGALRVDGSAVNQPSFIVDGITPSHKATVSQFHNADNQSPGSSAYGVLTGGVAQLLNALGNLDRQRETGQSNIPSLGIATGTQQVKSPISTTLNGAVSAGGTSATLTATKFTNRGSPAWVQAGSTLTFEFGTTSQESVYVTAVNYGTNVVTIIGLGAGNGFQFAHANNAAVAAGAYNEAVDATAADGATGAGMTAQSTFLYNQQLNSGNGGFEVERSAAGEMDGPPGAGGNVAFEYEHIGANAPNSWSPGSGAAQYDRARGVQAKGLASLAISSASTGQAVVTLSSAAPSWLVAGQHVRLTNSTTAADASAEDGFVQAVSGTSVTLGGNIQNSGHTLLVADTFSANGPGTSGFTPHGMGIEEEALYDPVSGLFYIERSATQDGMAAQNIVAESPALWNGATMDRWTGSASRGADVNIHPTSSSAAAIGPTVSAASEFNHVFKTSAGNLYDVYCFSSQAGYVLGFDATSVPADGAVTPKWVFAVAANQSGALTYAGLPPASFSTGCCFCFSTTAPFTKTTPGSGTAFFSARFQ